MISLYESKKNMQNLLDSGIIEEKDVSKLVDTFNTQFEKCTKDSATNFKQAGTDLFNQLKEGLTSGDWEDAFSDATKGMDNWTNEMLQKQGIIKIDNIFLATYNVDGNLSVYLTNNTKK